MVNNSHCEMEPLYSRMYIDALRDAGRRTPNVLALEHSSIRSYKDPPKKHRLQGGRDYRESNRNPLICLRQVPRVGQTEGV